MLSRHAFFARRHRFTAAAFGVLARFQDKRRLHIKARDPERAQALLPWRDVETLVSLHGFQDIQVMKNGMVIPPQLYEAESNMSTLHDVLAQGASITVSQIHLQMPQIQWLATAVERELGLEVGVNAYCSFSAGGAFKPHWDRHDVLVIQVHGTKLWRIWDATVGNPIERSVDAQHDVTAAPARKSSSRRAMCSTSLAASRTPQPSPVEGRFI